MSTEVRWDKCATCGRSGRAGLLPKGFVMECERCHEATPGKARKAVRHCTVCRAPIVTFGISGGVRLICPTCARLDTSLIDLEKSAKAQVKLRDQVQSAQAEIQKLCGEQAQMREDFQKKLEERIGETLEENERLKREMEAKAQDTLADRIKAKVRLKYGESDKRKLMDFLEWLQKTHADFWAEGVKVNMEDAPDSVSFDEWLQEVAVDGIVDEYLGR